MTTPEEINSHQILITEPIFNSIKNRKNISEFLFENLGIPSIFFGNQPVLSLLGAGHTSGAILESGIILILLHIKLLKKLKNNSKEQNFIKNQKM